MKETDDPSSVLARLVEEWVTLLREANQQQKALKAERAELLKSTRAFMDWWQRGNGSGQK